MRHSEYGILHNGRALLCLVSFKLTFTYAYNPFLPSVNMLQVIMLSAIMLCRCALSCSSHPWAVRAKNVPVDVPSQKTSNPLADNELSLLK
jgi:hypothetical protein